MTTGRPSDGEIRRAIESQVPRRFRVAAPRRRVTRSDLPAEAEESGGVELGSLLQDLWDGEARASQLHAQRTRALAALAVDPGAEDDARLELELNADRAALALQVTRQVALRRILDARMAVHSLPRSLERLADGRMPVDRFTRLLRSTRALRDPHRWIIDQLVEDWGEGLTADAFERRLRQLVVWMTDRMDRAEGPREPRRGIEVLPPAEDGTACLQVFGPAPEILDLGRRIDAAARAVQDVQRRALAAGTDVPLDPAGAAAGRGRPLPLTLIGYQLLRTASFDTEGVEVPQPRFRMNVTVPAMTLLGVSDAPGLLDGITPVPADMARELAGGCDVWHRVLTDPSTGAYLPLATDTYRPSAGLLEHLRQRGPTCAVPSCTRSVCTASENDHIREYDLAHPELGGPTSSENCHLLCWMHHRMKTLGMLDPVRLGPAPGSGPPGLAPGRTRWRIGAAGERCTAMDDVDLMTPVVVAEFEELWEAHQERERRRLHPPRPDPGPPPPF